jgi:hypothetical protein
MVTSIMRHANPVLNKFKPWGDMDPVSLVKKIDAMAHRRAAVSAAICPRYTLCEMDTVSPVSLVLLWRALVQIRWLA